MGWTTARSGGSGGHRDAAAAPSAARRFPTQRQRRDADATVLSVTTVCVGAVPQPRAALPAAAATTVAAATRCSAAARRHGLSPAAAAPPLSPPRRGSSGYAARHRRRRTSWTTVTAGGACGLKGAVEPESTVQDTLNWRQVVPNEAHVQWRYCCIPNFVRSDRSQEGVDQLRLSERCKIPVRERARMLTCPNRRLLESSLVADLAPLSSLWTQSSRI